MSYTPSLQKSLLPAVLAFRSRHALLVSVLICLLSVAALQGSGHFGLSSASYLGYEGSEDEVFGVRIQSDGTVVIAAQIGDAQPNQPGSSAPVTPVLLNGATASSSGVILRLAPDGKTILSVTRISDHIRDLAVDSDDNLYVAAGPDGLIKLNPSASSLLGVAQVGRYVKRVTTSAHYVATLVPDNPATAHITPGPGDITLFLAETLDVVSEFRGFRHTLDIAIHEPSETLVLTGWRQANSWQEDGAGVLPVQIAYLRAVDFSGGIRWDAYDWDTHSNINGGNEFASETLTFGNFTIPQGFIIITNPLFLNSNGSAMGTLPDGRTVYGYMNHMADTRGYRVTIGDDGLLYVGYEAAGGNHIFRQRGGREPNASDFRANTPLAGGDFFHSFINTGAGHKTYVGRYDPVTGFKLAGNQFNTLIMISSGQSANTLRISRGGLHADANGRLYLAGAAASGLPLTGNALFTPQATETTLNPFGLGTNEGGAYLWIMDSDLSTRLFVGRLSAGNSRAVHARVPVGATDPVIAWGGQAALTRPMFVFNPIQQQPGYGTQDGFFAVLGGAGPVDGPGRYLFEFGGSYTASNTTLRGVAPTSRTEQVDGQTRRIIEYPFSTETPLSPPAPNYSGPVFFGGYRASSFNRDSINFNTNQFSGSTTNIRVESNSPLETRRQGVFFFTKESMAGVEADDVLRFDSESFLILSGTEIPQGRWLVRDGDTFYVSQTMIGGAGSTLTFASSEDNGAWAVFDPADPLEFDPAAFVFSTRSCPTSPTSWKPQPICNPTPGNPSLTRVSTTPSPTKQGYSTSPIHKRSLRLSHAASSASR